MRFQNVLKSILITITAANFVYCQIINGDPKGPYLGQSFPGTTPKIFANSIVPPGLHTPPVFTPDGKEIYWKNMFKYFITSMKMVDSFWSSPQDISFSSNFSSVDDPSISPDGKKLFFTSWGVLPNTQLPSKENIWYVEKKDNGWTEPKPVDIVINSINLHWLRSVDKKDNLYFSSLDLVSHEAKICCSKFIDGKYQNPITLDESLNAKNCMQFSPYISPNGDYLIFDRSIVVNGQGENHKILIVFLKSDGTWTTPQALFKSGQFSGNCRTAYVSPDGKYLFFIYWDGNNWQTYWVDEKIIEQIRPATGTYDKTGYIPEDFNLYQNYPNPFNPSTSIKYEIPKTSNVRLEIFNIHGKKVRVLVKNVKEPGCYSITWNGIDDFGTTVSSGLYFYRLTSGNFCQTNRMIFLK